MSCSTREEARASGFARHIKFVEDYDPSLPPVLANRDQFIQVFLNLVKNAAEAIGDQPTADRADHRVPPGVRLRAGQQDARVAAARVLRRTTAGVPPT
jgi:two-component system nitrogen regulation sensor histidine kinase GlnL